MTTTVSSERTAGAAVPTTSAPAEVRATVLPEERIHAALERITHPERINAVVLVLGIAAWAAFGLSVAVPNHPDLPLRDVQSLNDSVGLTVGIGLGVAIVSVLLWVLAVVPSPLRAWAHTRVSRGADWLLGAGVFALFWEFTTAKLLIFEPPYLVAPQQILLSIWEDRLVLGESLGNSLLLLAVGFIVGLVAGLATGVTIGWFQTANYWVHPILTFIGPVPSLAWVPIVFVLAPTTYSGAVFMIALSVWFPISVLTRAGVASVPRSYFDVAQTSGASPWFLVFRVSLPAALPSIFTGLFMALGASFASLVVAENFGVNAGLGWYLNWKKSWGDFTGLYGGIIVLILLCGIALTVLSRVRRWVLRWEKELTRW